MNYLEECHGKKQKELEEKLNTKIHQVSQLKNHLLLVQQQVTQQKQGVQPPPPTQNHKEEVKVLLQYMDLMMKHQDQLLEDFKKTF